MPTFRRTNPRHVRLIWRAIQERARGREPIPEGVGENPTASKRAILRYGRMFIRSFNPRRMAKGKIGIQMGVSLHESPVSLQLTHQTKLRNEIIGKIKIGFEGKTIVIESIQGSAPKREVDAASAILGRPWIECLLDVMEAHAKKHGFTHAFLRDPTTLYWYRNPQTGFEDDPARHDERASQIQGRMKSMYGIVAKKRGYKKTPGGFEKEL